MHTTQPTDVSLLSLDLQNYRTIPQATEAKAIRAMVLVPTDAKRFWALAKSLIDDGFLPNENVIVLRGSEPNALLVKEGNRRVAAMKLLLGLEPIGDLVVPAELKKSIAGLTPEWRSANSQVPCAIYEASDKDTVDRIVSMTHGLAEDAGRTAWESIARARHARDTNGVASPALELVEMFLAASRDITDNQREMWAGTFPLTILVELLRMWLPRLGAASPEALVADYRAGTGPRTLLDRILRDIAEERLGFKGVRGSGTDDAGHHIYGLPPSTPAPAAGGAPATGAPPESASGAPPGSSGGAPASSGSASGSSSSAGAPKPTGATPGAAKTRGKTAVVASNDPKSVKRALRSFKAAGKGREKVVTLVEEMKKMDLEKTPLAFCFLLRSMFEISAKAYFTDHKLSWKNKKGEEKKLVEMLGEIAKHIADLQPTNPEKMAKTKLLHGARTHLGTKDGILSVTSMNQLVHNPNFSVSAKDIATGFNNVFPLLIEMNV